MKAPNNELERIWERKHLDLFEMRLPSWFFAKETEEKHENFSDYNGCSDEHFNPGPFPYEVKVPLSLFRQYIYTPAGIAQLVSLLTTGWTVRGSKTRGGEIFGSHPGRP